VFSRDLPEESGRSLAKGTIPVRPIDLAPFRTDDLMRFLTGVVALVLLAAGGRRFRSAGKMTRPAEGT